MGGALARAPQAHRCRSGAHACGSAPPALGPLQADVLLGRGQDPGARCPLGCHPHQRPCGLRPCASISRVVKSPLGILTSLEKGSSPLGTHAGFHLSESGSSDALHELFAGKVPDVAEADGMPLPRCNAVPAHACRLVLPPAAWYAFCHEQPRVILPRFITQPACPVTAADDTLSGRQSLPRKL